MISKPSFSRRQKKSTILPDEYLCTCLKAAGTLIGFLAIQRRKDQEGKVLSLGYIFHPAYQGQGYALEGCRSMLDYVFNELKAVAILTGTNLANQASVRLLQKLGLRKVNQEEFYLRREEWQAFATVNTPLKQAQKDDNSFTGVPGQMM
jgi:RimJ/RimL family protein N-acetyltransferase